MSGTLLVSLAKAMQSYEALIVGNTMLGFYSAIGAGMYITIANIYLFLSGFTITQPTPKTHCECFLEAIVFNKLI